MSRKKRHSNDLLYRRGKHFEAVLRSIGLAQAWEAMPTKLRDVVLLQKRPDIDQQWSPAVPTALRMQLEKEVDRIINEPSIDFCGNGRRCSFQDYLWCVREFHNAYSAWAPMRSHDHSCQTAKFDDQSLLRDPKQVVVQHLNAFRHSLLLMATRYTRLDQSLPIFRVRCRATPQQDLQITIQVDTCSPEKRSSIRNGESRPSFRCGVGGGGKVQWASLPSSIDMRSGQSELPVFIQSHVFRRLDERLHMFRNSGLVNTILLSAFLFPEVVNMQGREAWIACNDHEKRRLGYFICELQDDHWLATTFLFLTMQGTPEAAKLHDLLRVRRKDIEYLRLDEISTFANSDLSKDAELVALFNQCGCGHLFRLKQDYGPSDIASGVAAEIRRYLRLPPLAIEAA